MTLILNRPWSNKSNAHCLIILDICAKLFVKPTRGSEDIERTWNTVIQCLIFDCDLDLEPTLVKHSHCTSSHHTGICAKLFVNPTRGLKDVDRKRNTVIQCLILDCDLDLEPTLVKHRHCTSSHHTWHLCKVICKSHQGFKRYRADTKYIHKMLNLRVWPWPWSDLGQSKALHLSHHTWHLCKVICKTHQGFKTNRADTKYSHTMFNLRLWPWP